MRTEIATVRTKVLGTEAIRTLVDQDTTTFDGNVYPSKFNPDLADKDIKIAVYVSKEDELNRRNAHNILAVDVHVPLLWQNETGIGLDIIEAVKTTLKSLKVGRGLKYENTLLEQDTAPGWWKSTILYWYNTAKSQ